MKSPAQLATAATKKAARQRGNEMTAVYFAVAILGFFALFTILNWVDVVLRTHSSRTEGTLKKAVRTSRSTLIRKVPGFTTLGHAIIFILYIGINITLSFQNVDWSVGTLNNWAKRMGWVALCNLALTTFLALKNTPLAFLVGTCYKKLNPLHQAAGYTTVGLMLVHAIVYIRAWQVSDSIHELKLVKNMMGVVAGLAMLIMAATALLIRKPRYEVFYVAHILCFMLIVISVGMHRPKPALNVIWAPIFTGAVWMLDRSVRFARISYYAYANKATLTPLAGGGVRISMRCTDVHRAEPGTHAFLWMPSIRVFETHPFTISSTNPLEFVIAAHSGFTKELVARAVAQPGIALRASIDGPYGALPDFQSFDRFVLIAGGSGASFTFGVAMNYLQTVAAKSEQSSTAVIDFIWVVRELEFISWFRRELIELHASPLVRLTVHVTRLENSFNFASLSSSTKPFSPSSSLNEKHPIGSDPIPMNSDIDVEKTQPSSAIAIDERALTIISGRPEVCNLLHHAVSRAEEEGARRILIAACGPQSMMNETRAAAADIMRARRKASVRYFAEEFGW